jgi:hypothetical protein
MFSRQVLFSDQGLGQSENIREWMSMEAKELALKHKMAHHMPMGLGRRELCPGLPWAVKCP